MTITRCPFCSSESLVPHCALSCYPSPTCDLWTCARCNSYGRLFDPRWVEARRVA